MRICHPCYYRAKFGNVVLAHCLGLLAGFFIHKIWVAKSETQSRNINRSLWTRNAHFHDQSELNLQFENGTRFEVGSHKEHGDSEEGQELYRRVRVLCWVMTQPANHMTKARHVLATWGKRCNHFLFMSSQTDQHDLPKVVQINVSEGREHLWEKTTASFRYIHENYADKADWFLKADDDTYVIVDNLRFFLNGQNPKEPVYFGCHFKPYVKQGYMSGGAGYVISREALNRLGAAGVSNTMECRPRTGGAEDVQLGRCLESLNVTAGDSRDSFGRGRFFPLAPEYHLIPGLMPKDFWYWNWTYDPAIVGMEACSDTAISFHYVKPTQMYVMEYLIYHLRPYGFRVSDEPPAKEVAIR